MSDTDHDADLAEAAPATPATPAHRAVRAADAGVLAEGFVELLRATLIEMGFDAEKVEAAMKRAQKAPAMKSMLAKIKIKGAAKGQTAYRSAYTIFVTDALSHLKAAGVDATLSEVSSIWRTLPLDVKQELNTRYGAVKDTFNTKLADGQAVNLGDEMAAYAQQHALHPVDYVHLYNTYKGAAAANGSGGAKAQAKAKPQAKPKAPAATPAAAPAAPAAPAAAAGPESGKRAADPGSEHKSHKKHKKDKEKKDKKYKKKKDREASEDDD